MSEIIFCKKKTAAGMLLLCLLLTICLAAGCGKRKEPVLEEYPLRLEDALPQEVRQETGDGTAAQTAEGDGSEARTKPGVSAGRPEDPAQTGRGQTADTESRSADAAGTGPAADAGKDLSAGREADTEKAGTQGDSTIETGSADGEDPPGTVTVHVCGAVKKEGVYTLPAESRIRDAVEAAGGFSKEADTAYLNLARELEDAVQIRVPTKEEAAELRAGQAPASLYGAQADTVSPYGAADTEALSAQSEGGKNAAGAGNGSGSGQKSSASGGGSGTGAASDPVSAEEKININTASREELMKIPGVGEVRAQRILEYREKNGPFERIEDLMKISGIKKASFEKMRAYVTV